MSMFDIHYRCNELNHLFSYHPLCFDMVLLTALFLMQLFQFRLIQCERLLLRLTAYIGIFGKKSVSAKFKASIMSSDRSSKVKSGLPSTLFLVFDATCISSFPLLNFLS